MIRTGIGCALLITVGCLLSGCASGPWPQYGERRPLVPHPTYKIGSPYTVQGVTYQPHVDLAYDETGLASWYGEAFNGQYTANGEVFDLNQLTAAHPTLPLPSIVEVVNLENNRALRVRVNDRGPFAGGRILDVSRRVADLLGFERAGTTRVRVRILKDESLEAEAAAERGIVSNGGGGLYAAAALPVPPPAQAAEAHQFLVQSPLYRMEIGPVATREEADRALNRMLQSGYTDAHIVIN
jgi:rare lipoprotein A (peptidoglycan hydrolase)